MGSYPLTRKVLQIRPLNPAPGAIEVEVSRALSAVCAVVPLRPMRRRSP